ncbi:hypothetical protein Tco_1051353, partial [Tanacetum coccineum]
PGGGTTRREDVAYFTVMDASPGNVNDSNVILSGNFLNVQVILQELLLRPSHSPRYD